MTDGFRWHGTLTAKRGAVLFKSTMLGCTACHRVGDTGGVILNDLMTVIFVLFVFAALLLPLLTEFGLMEFIGTLVRPFFRPVFRLPGRASIDARTVTIDRANAFSLR